MGAQLIRLSAVERESYLRQMTEATLDVLVIGGGITGAGIALDASTRGLRVGLVEKQDFAEGTSSRSTKLIHGGLRYLKQGEIGLVREVGRERAILHRNAPHLVTPEKMLLPIVAGGTYGKLGTAVGLWVYDRLAGVRHSERRVMLSKEATLRAEPLLSRDKLRGGGLYYEYRTDDARLTVEVMKTATQYGALCANYVEATEFLNMDGKVVGARVFDHVGQTSWEIRARKVVNAAGPWVDELRRKDHSLRGKRLHLTKGVHIVVERARLALQQSVYFDVPDGRMVFAIPRGNATYVGTTDTDYKADLERPVATNEDVVYLLAAANRMFPVAQLTADDVQSTWAGLRPLIHEDGKSPSELSRRDEMFVSDSGLVSIAGGKLTGYRKMAERVVDLVLRELVAEQDYAFQPCFTDQVTLSGGEPVSETEQRQWTRRLTKIGLTEAAAENVVQTLVGRYGSNTGEVVAVIEQTAVDGLSADTASVAGEFYYTVQNEMAMDPTDFLVRRSGRLYFDPKSLEPLLEPIWAAAAQAFDWSVDQVRDARARWNAEYLAATRFAVRDLTAADTGEQAYATASTEV